jgi:hypothetical protein
MDCKELIEIRKKEWEETQDIENDQNVCKAIWNKISNTKEIFVELLENPWLLIELQFTVIDKEFKELPFFLNDVQIDFQEKLSKLYKQQQQKKIDQIKIAILKGRQQGFTTYITAFQCSLLITQKNFAGFTMAHDADSTKSIFEDIAKGIFDRVDKTITGEPKRSNAKELVLDRMGTSWRVSTAGSKGAGRGKKLQMLHNSEKAFWKDMQKNALAISQALTPTGSIEIDETTANGFNEFYDKWEEIEKGHSKWLGFFYEWWRTKEYTKRFETSKYTEDQFVTALETGARFMGVDSAFMKKLKSIVDNVGLTLEQANWYFDKRMELKDEISQEYPCTAKEAFLHSGRPYFDIELIDIQLQQTTEEFETRQGGEIEIYKHPEPGHTYIIGADVAEGLEGKDNSTFCILDVETLEEVANGEYTLKPEQHARELAKWGNIYNDAYIGVERNNHGHSTLNTLKNEIEYFNLYKETTHDRQTDKKTEKLGWSTNSKSKYIMLDELDSFHREEKVIINSYRTLAEMRTIQKENGLVNTNGKDRVVALAIALQMRKTVSQFFII